MHVMNDHYFVDENEIGGGAMNIFIYADDALASVVPAKLETL